MTFELTVADQAGLTSGRDAWHTKPVGSVGLPAITVTDGPHGVRLQTDPATCCAASRPPAFLRPSPPPRPGILTCCGGWARPWATSAAR